MHVHHTEPLHCSAGHLLGRNGLVCCMSVDINPLQLPVISGSIMPSDNNHNISNMNKAETPSDYFSDLHSIAAIGLSPALVGIILGVYTLWYLAVPALKKQNTTGQPPIVGYRSLWEPTWLVRLRFIRGSRRIIGEGYEQVSNHNSKFRSDIAN